jgi:hypothetical protein
MESGIHTYEQRVESFVSEIDSNVRELVKIAVDAEARVRRSEHRIDTRIDEATQQLHGLVAVASSLLEEHRAELRAIRAAWKTDIQSAGTSAGVAYAKQCGETLQASLEGRADQIVQRLSAAAGVVEAAAKSARWRTSFIAAVAASLAVAVALRF